MDTYFFQLNSFKDFILLDKNRVANTTTAHSKYMYDSFIFYYYLLPPVRAGIYF